MSRPTTRDEVLEAARTAGIELVHLQFTDVPGTIKSVTIPAHRLAHAFDDGTWFDTCEYTRPEAPGLRIVVKPTEILGKDDKVIEVVG